MVVVKCCLILLYPPSERSETGGYYVFTFVRPSVCLSVCAHMAAVFRPLMPIARKRLKIRTSNFTSVSVGTVRTQRLEKFWKRERGQGHVTPYIFWELNANCSKRLKIRSSNLTSTSKGTVRTRPLRKIPNRGRGHGHVTP